MAGPEILRYYEQYDEHSRLTSGIGAVEFARTLELLARYLPPPPCHVLDIGGGTGTYAETLARQAYEVHLLDLVPKHVEVARRRPHIASATLGDARHLPWPDRFARAVLLMGPLYHLTESPDRDRALAEALRVLQPGGTLAAAAISRFAPLTEGLRQGFIDDPVFQPILLQDLECGQHRNTTPDLARFTTAYFHLPGEFAAEIESAGFARAEVYGVEGLAWAAPDLEQRWADPPRREFLMQLLRRTEREPAILGASHHLLAFATRPG